MGVRREKAGGGDHGYPYVKPHGRRYLDSLISPTYFSLLNMFGRGRLQDQTWLIGEISASMEQIKSTNHLLIRKRSSGKGSPEATT